jgi:peptide/nickel transport system substrate-binding protein
VLGDLQALDAHVTTGLDSTRRVWDIVTALDEKLDVVPVLAESLELSRDARQMKLNLRKGVQFHTGRELTSEDLLWNFNRLKDPKVNPTYANLVKPFATMETPDKYTLTVQFDAPNPFVVDALPALPMMDPVTFQQAGVNKPVGTGPFTFTEWIQGEKITLKKNPNYWDKGKPYLDQLEFTIFTDPQALISHFEAGALDVAIQPTLNDWVRIQREQKAQALINQNSGNYLAVAFNVTQPPTDNKLVRQALNLALDRKRVAQTVWQSVEKPITLLWFPTSPAYDAAKNEVYAFDLDKARATLAQAGMSTASVDYNYPSTNPEYALIGQIWQADLAKVGITMNLKAVEPVALTTSMINVKYQGIGVGTGFYGQLHGGVVWTSPYYGPVNNRSGFQDDKYRELTLAVYSEADPSKRKPVYDAWNDYVLDHSHVTAISTLLPRAVAQPNVQGLTYSIGGNYLDVTAASFA